MCRGGFESDGEAGGKLKGVRPERTEGGTGAAGGIKIEGSEGMGMYAGEGADEYALFGMKEQCADGIISGDVVDGLAGEAGFLGASQLEWRKPLSVKNDGAAFFTV